MSINPLFFYIIIVIEGYIVLSSELLAIRQTVPFVGSGTDTVSIIIAAVLMPLAVGYYMGGHYRARRRFSPRRKLLKNLCISAMFLVIGLSTWTINSFFLNLTQEGVTHRLAMTAIYSLVFIVTPVYLLGQTVPLISNYFSKQQLSKITGKMLFFSTLGSFFGSIFSTLILMSFLGVHYTVTFLFILFSIITFIIANKKRDRDKIVFILLLTVFSALINSGTVMKALNIVSNNQYNTIQIFNDSDNVTHFVQNNSDSSAIGPNGFKHEYILLLEKLLIQPLQYGRAKNILVIGAGGFTFGLEDAKNNYTYIDIDPSLEKIATEGFLQRPLTKNKKFIPESAQSFVNIDKNKYDLILLDAYTGDVTIPEDLVTADFFRSIKNKLNPDGVVAMNFIVSPTFRDTMSRNLDNTLRTVFPYIARETVQPYSGWETNPYLRLNVLYIYADSPLDKNTGNTIYTRDKNQFFFDKPQKRN